MIRAVIGVIVGYLAMAVVVFILFSAAYMLMGTERAFQPHSYKVSGLWIVTSIVLGFGAALVGGVVCKAISRNGTVVLVLAGIVLVLGIAMAIPVLMAEDPLIPQPRIQGVGTLEAMNKAKQPDWLALLNPLIGAAGIFLGGRMICAAEKE